MARNNNISATFSQDAGDGASGFSESSGTKSFTSGDAIKIEGSIDTSAIQYATASFGFTQADGIYFENRDSTNFVTLTLQESASGSDLCALKIAPNSVFTLRFDASQTAITHVTLQADTATCDFVLCLAE
tara:strand:+ start:210 stop:599 length:390 start_codon:yes stop_codon:yes gene_type:complete